MVRILIINGQNKLQKETTNLLMACGDFKIVGTGSDGFEALILSEKLKPDVVIMSTNLKLLNGMKACPSIAERSPETKVILVADAASVEIITQITVSNIRGILLQRDVETEIVSAVHQVVCENRCFLGKNIVSHALDTIIYYKSIIDNAQKKSAKRENPQRTAPLAINKLEMRIVSLIAQGLSNKEIAALLNLKEGTIRNYISAILRKTGYHHRAQIVIYAVVNNLVDVTDNPQRNLTDSSVSKHETKSSHIAQKEPSSGKTANSGDQLETTKK